MHAELYMYMYFQHLKPKPATKILNQPPPYCHFTLLYSTSSSNTSFPVELIKRKSAPFKTISSML